MGKLLGPRGNSLKRLQEETLTKMSILGKGSMRDKAKVIFVRDGGNLLSHHAMCFETARFVNAHRIEAS